MTPNDDKNSYPKVKTLKFFLTQVLSKLKLIDNQDKSNHSWLTIEEKTDSGVQILKGI